MGAPLSNHYLGRTPSAIRQAQIFFAERPDRQEIDVVNVAIGNVCLPMHPAMRARLQNLGRIGPFADGVVRYGPSTGHEECRQALLRGIAVCGAPTGSLHPVVTDGGSLAMELMVLGVCGPSSRRPLLVLDPVYTNYVDMARRCGVQTISYRRTLGDDGLFTLPDLDDIEQLMLQHKPAALLVIPADNPTGQYLRQEDLRAFAKLCVAHDIWLVSDEAYRHLNYDDDDPASTIWNITEAEVPGVSGRRISIESASKVWNACGLRVGGLVSDNQGFHERAVAEHTANLSANVLGQHVFAAIAHESDSALHEWFSCQREYYRTIMRQVCSGLEERVPGILVSRPQAAIYSVIDVRSVAGVEPGFDAAEFVAYCARHGRVTLHGFERETTLLVSPMAEFYAGRQPGDDIGSTQMRLAFVETPAKMAQIPELFAKLLRGYLSR